MASFAVGVFSNCIRRRRRFFCSVRHLFLKNLYDNTLLQKNKKIKKRLGRSFLKTSQGILMHAYSQLPFRGSGGVERTLIPDFRAYIRAYLSQLFAPRQTRGPYKGLPRPLRTTRAVGVLRCAQQQSTTSDHRTGIICPGIHRNLKNEDGIGTFR